MDLHSLRSILEQVQQVVRPLLRRQKLVYISAAIFCALLLGSLVRRHNVQIRHPYMSASDKNLGPTRQSFDTVEIDLHLLMPATEPNAELCKGILSAVVLDYPTPTLINWGKQFTDTHLRFNGSHIGKIDGVLEYLDSVGDHKGNQLVLMVDAYDQWFQLPPSILRARFRSVGRALYDYSTTMYGPKAMEKEGISQSVIMGAEKNCGPGKQQVDEVACYGQPESPVREDLYGEFTDVRDEETHLPLHKRPAFLNSGFMLGPLQDMRALMRRAKQKAYANDKHLGSDQRIFNEIFGEQGYYRELMRQRHRSFFRKCADVAGDIMGLSTPRITDRHPTHKPANVTKEGGPYEFGLGLDYNLELTQSAVLSEFDGRFLTYGQQEMLMQALTGPNLPDPPRALTLPADLSQEEKSGVDWLKQPLYTNVWTSSVPITIHMNGIKTMRQHLWKEMWFVKGAREKLIPKQERVALDSSGRALLWKDICGQYEAEVLLDTPLRFA